MNTGRTHFKKGIAPWNKGVDLRKAGLFTTKMEEAFKKQKGRPMPKPPGFSETMRKANPPQGRKKKWGEGQYQSKKMQVWRDGYIMLYKPDHPTSRKKPPDFGYVLEHRFVIENIIGKSLTKNQVVHHVDGKKSNNDPSNLILCASNKEHNEIHNKMEIFVEKLIRDGKVFYDRNKKDFFFR